MGGGFFLRTHDKIETIEPNLSETTMQEPQIENNTNPTEVQTIAPNVFQRLLGDWRIKFGLIGSAIGLAVLGLFLLLFFWNHTVAGMGMRSWASSAGAAPIECMIKDTNNDGYVSCSAMLKGQVVPLECGSSLFNIGCRVNYGAAAAPQVRSQNR
ncbi:hypothetical protein J0895_20720 [Phormidium pseudopriestleyi FRX01]|uniref:Uncharacterized protein n=2 Tax=Phormidium TaxID=1198 RepID=A0ABS3FWI4_9CYAN|nr:hypothetical protein [Phormidium pseudopriestleyi FRX01]